MFFAAVVVPAVAIVTAVAVSFYLLRVSLSLLFFPAVNVPVAMLVLFAAFCCCC